MPSIMYAGLDAAFCLCSTVEVWLQLWFTTFQQRRYFEFAAWTQSKVRAHISLRARMHVYNRSIRLTVSRSSALLQGDPGVLAVSYSLALFLVSGVCLGPRAV